ncbi:DUF262 domain-containing protein [Micromonospora sp. NPDC049359]|uniref:DUF262 domain-containing protein n=1 Tax=unclassified Micromonospora TaxID=2617518 RepID=UPI00379B730B
MSDTYQGDGEGGLENEQFEPEGVSGGDDQDTPIPDLEPISYFGTDFDVHGLVRRLNNRDIVVPNFDPAVESESDLSGFQRKFVWKKPQMDRFVESLLLGFPVPGIFLVQQANKQLLVLDGQQRLRTLQRFYAGKINPKVEFKLEHVTDKLKELTYSTLDDEQRRLLDNTFIHATVVKYNSQLGGDESVYSLFERLNTGGTNLYPQEIRVALFHGSLVELLREFNGHPSWRAIYGPISERLKDQELILRFLAFHQEEGSYRRPLKVFLNTFLADHRNLEGLDVANLRQVFAETCDVLARTLGRKALRPESQINAAFADAILMGMSSRLSRGPLQDESHVAATREQLLRKPDFVSAVARATADEDRVERRLRMAREAFEELA